MDFGQALKMMKANQWVRRTRWPDGVAVRLAVGELWKLDDSRNVAPRWRPGIEDMLAEDWRLG